MPLSPYAQRHQFSPTVTRLPNHRQHLAKR